MAEVLAYYLGGLDAWHRHILKQIPTSSNPKFLEDLKINFDSLEIVDWKRLEVVQDEALFVAALVGGLMASWL